MPAQTLEKSAQGQGMPMRSKGRYRCDVQAAGGSAPAGDRQQGLLSGKGAPF